jgi:DNA-binding transcriptional LysR family regulator
MELRHIRYFLAVAQEGNFTRAAARLGIGQPPLSLQIRDLEAEVGTQLFYRLPHGAELTEAGQAFFEQVKAMPAQAATAALAARRAARGETGSLSLGFTGSAIVNAIVPASIKAFRRAYPEVELKLEEGNALALLANLQQGRLDMAILRPSDSDPPDIHMQLLAHEPLVAALPSAHPQAGGRGALDLATLADTPFILTPRSVGVSLNDATLKACRGAGFEPIPGQPAPHIASILTLVSAELGVALVPQSMRQLSVPGITYRPIRKPAPQLELVVAYRRQRPPKLALNFATVARSVTREAKGELP